MKLSLEKHGSLNIHFAGLSQMTLNAIFTKYIKCTLILILDKRFKSNHVAITVKCIYLVTLEHFLNVIQTSNSIISN